MALLLLDAKLSQSVDREMVLERRAIVKALALTDLSLCTEARYTRNSSLADWHAPSQDHPLALDHFPSGSIIVRPPHLRLRHNGGE